MLIKYAGQRRALLLPAVQKVDSPNRLRLETPLHSVDQGRQYESARVVEAICARTNVAPRGRGSAAFHERVGRPETERLQGHEARGSTQP